MSALIEGKIIIQGVQYDYTPGMFKVLKDDFGVRFQSTATGNGKRVVVVAKPNPDTSRPGIEYRLTHRKAWNATWGATSWMSPAMYKHLSILHEGAVPFWIQFDDVMSFNFDALRCADGVGHVWLTTHNPIAPFGQMPDAPREHAGNLYVNRNLIYTGFTIDDEFGVVYFDTAIDPTSEVLFRYTWRAYVWLPQFEAADIEDQMAQTVYVGSALFEQLTPNYADDPWYVYPTDWDFETQGLPHLTTTPDDSTYVTTPIGYAIDGNTGTNSGSTANFTNATAISGEPNTDNASVIGIGAGGKSNLVLTSGFDLAAPIMIGATIHTVRAAIFAKATPNTGIGMGMVDDSVYLRKSGSRIGTNQATGTIISNDGDWLVYEIDATGLGLTASDFNNKNIGLDFSAKAELAAYDSTQFSVGYVYAGNTYSSSPTTTSTTPWGTGGSTISDTTTQSSAAAGSVISKQSGQITINVTYTGSGSGPAYAFVTVNSQAKASTDNPVQRTAYADNGLNMGYTLTTEQNEAVSSGSQVFKVPLVSKHGQIVLNINASAARTFTSAEATSDSPTAHSEVTVSASVTAAPTSGVEVYGMRMGVLWSATTYTPPSGDGGGSGSGGSGSGGSGPSAPSSGFGG